MLLVLFPDGDSIARSNDVETAYRRVNPDDWDDDGIANERDLNPLFCDGDFFGVANALPTNANPDAHYLLDLSVTGVLGVATIRVTCDGPYAASVSANFSKDAVIFEDAYENMPGEWVSRRSTATMLTTLRG